MQVGIVGFAGGGKSTLFQLLTGARPDPGKIHSGQVGVATLADPRLDFLAELHQPKKVTPATVEFLDTPGLLAGSHGDNPQRLALIREGDALLIVLAGFAGGDPAIELTSFREEMHFADLTVVTNRVERLEASIKKPRPDREALAKELELVKTIQAALEARGNGGLHGPLGRGQEAAALLRPAHGQAAGRGPQRAAGHRDPGGPPHPHPRRAVDRRQARAGTLSARARGAGRLHDRPGDGGVRPRPDHPRGV